MLSVRRLPSVLYLLLPLQGCRVGTGKICSRAESFHRNMLHWILSTDSRGYNGVENPDSSRCSFRIAMAFIIAAYAPGPLRWSVSDSKSFTLMAGTKFLTSKTRWAKFSSIKVALVKAMNRQSLYCSGSLKISSFLIKGGSPPEYR